MSQGVWRDSETEEVVDMTLFWGPGQVVIFDRPDVAGAVLQIALSIKC